MLFITNIKLTIYVLFTIPIAAYIITKLGQSIRRKSMRSSFQIAGLMNVFQESISGIRIVKAFIMEKFEIMQTVQSVLDSLPHGMNATKDKLIRLRNQLHNADRIESKFGPSAYMIENLRTKNLETDTVSGISTLTEKDI